MASARFDSQGPLRITGEVLTVVMVEVEQTPSGAHLLQKLLSSLAPCAAHWAAAFSAEALVAAR